MIWRPLVLVCVQQHRSGVMETIHGWTLDSNVRAAKERLDQKLRRKREAVIKRCTMIPSSDDLHTRTGTGYSRKKELILLQAPQHREHRQSKREWRREGCSSTSSLLAVQREVYSKKSVMQWLMRCKSARCALTTFAPAMSWRTSPAGTASTGLASCRGSRSRHGAQFCGCRRQRQPPWPQRRRLVRHDAGTWPVTLMSTVFNV
jgi:hypothetical protein